MLQLEKGHKVDMDNLHERLKKLKLERSNEKLQADLDIYKGKLDALEATHSRQHRELAKKLEGALEAIERIREGMAIHGGGEVGACSNNNTGINNDNSAGEWQKQKDRLDYAHEMISDLRVDVDLNTKQAIIADSNVRKNNLIIDKLGKVDNENVKA